MKKIPFITLLVYSIACNFAIVCMDDSSYEPSDASYTSYDDEDDCFSDSDGPKTDTDDELCTRPPTTKRKKVEPPKPQIGPLQTIPAKHPQAHHSDTPFHRQTGAQFTYRCEACQKELRAKEKKVLINNIRQHNNLPSHHSAAKLCGISATPSLEHIKHRIQEAASIVQRYFVYHCECGAQLQSDRMPQLRASITKHCQRKSHLDNGGGPQPVEIKPRIQEITATSDSTYSHPLQAAGVLDSVVSAPMKSRSSQFSPKELKQISYQLTCPACNVTYRLRREGALISQFLRAHITTQRHQDTIAGKPHLAQKLKSRDHLKALVKQPTHFVMGLISCNQPDCDEKFATQAHDFGTTLSQQLQRHQKNLHPDSQMSLAALRTYVTTQASLQIRERET